MKKYNMDLNEKELDLAFHVFDLNGNGEVFYDDILNSIVVRFIKLIIITLWRL